MHCSWHPIAKSQRSVLMLLSHTLTIQGSHLASLVKFNPLGKEEITWRTDRWADVFTISLELKRGDKYFRIASGAFVAGALTHCILNRLSHSVPHYILEESNFNFRYVRLWYLHIPREQWLNYLQKVEILIRHRILHLIWVCTVCQLPFYRSPNYNGLRVKTQTFIVVQFNVNHQFCCETVQLMSSFY